MIQHDKPGSADESGTRGPAGPLDDQPQREDEYLSSMLKEFNPQRKDKKTPLKSAPGKEEDRRKEQGSTGKKTEDEP